MALVILLFAGLNAGAQAQTPAGSLWDELKAKRETLVSLHQEFEVQQTSRTANNTQASKRQVFLDVAGGQWREKFSTGSGDYIRIFDGKDLFTMDGGGSEYIRVKRKAKDDLPVPSVYHVGDADWSKAMEVQRAPCGFKENDRSCIVLEAPIRKSMRSTSQGITKVLDGTERAMLDTETGMVLSLHTVQVIEPPSGRQYQSDTTYLWKRMSHNTPMDAALFKPSEGMTEVKELAKWNAARIKKQLVGTPAPELNVTDIAGASVDLTAFKGKTVLLDFWTTWCPPCRADAPALDGLYKKYGGENLMIVGISVSEDRPIVEKFLKEHPHKFPVVLTTENDMPRPYQIGVFPTYIIIDPDGKVGSAAEGDQGFGELRKLLKKAGIETN